MPIEERMDNTYFDKHGKQILQNDLLEVFHFSTKKKIYYMYHIVVMDSTGDFPVLSVRDYFSEKPHCRLYVLCNNKKRIHLDAKIIGEKDFTTIRKKINATL